MNTSKVQDEINSIISETRKGQPVRKQYPVAKHQIATLTELGIIDLMPAGFGYSDAASVIKAAQDSGMTVGGFLKSGEGDVATTDASALNQSIEEKEAAQNLEDIISKIDGIDGMRSTYGGGDYTVTVWDDMEGRYEMVFCRSNTDLAHERLTVSADDIEAKMIEFGMTGWVPVEYGS